MEDTTGKIEDLGATPSGRLAASEHNNVQQDIVNEVTRSGQDINASDFTQMSEASTLAAFRAAAMNVDGTSTANALVLVPRSGSTGHRIPTAPGPAAAPVYNRYEGSTINFTASANNTGAVTIDIGQTAATTIGTKPLLSSTGAALTSGDIVSGIRYECQYDITADSGNGAWLLTAAAAVQSDWAQTGVSQPDYIKNKPGSPTETTQGTPEVATQTETDFGSDDTRMVTPKKLAASVWTYNPGDIIQRTTQTAIGGDFLECNGQAVSRIVYSSLFTEIGTTHGIGNGSTTFNLPNIDPKFTPLSSNTFASLVEPLTNSVTDISTDPVRGDVYACASNEVQRWNKSSGTWTNLSPPAGSWVGISYDEFNDRIWIVSSGGTMYYTSYSPISWTAVGAAPSITYVGITTDGGSGDVYAFSSSAVYQSSAAVAYAVWNLDTTPSSGYTAMGANSRTGDIYLFAGFIPYVKETGIGSYTQRRGPPTTTSANALAVNGTTGTIYSSHGSSGRIYAAIDGIGNWELVGNFGVSLTGISVSHADGALSYSSATSVARRPGTSISSYIAF